MCPRLERFAATLFHGKPTTEMFSFYGPEIKSTQFGDAPSARCCPKARFFEVAGDWENIIRGSSWASEQTICQKYRGTRFAYDGASRSDT